MLTPDLVQSSSCQLIELELWHNSTCVGSAPILLVPQKKRDVAEVGGWAARTRGSLC